MVKLFLGLFARHLLSSAGGAVVAGGLATQNDVTVAVGAASTLVGVVWSAFQKYQSKNNTKKGD